MKAHALTYPSLQRRLISQRRSRAFFSPRTTQQVESGTLLAELLRAAAALAGVVTWGAVLLFLAA